MRMKRTSSAPLVLPLALILLLLAGGCSDDDPTQPDPVSFTGIQGMVLDVDGNPLEGVSVGLIFDLPGAVSTQQFPSVITHPAEKPMTEIIFDLPESQNVRIWITDYTGDFVVTLFDGVPGTDDIPIWDALNESGEVVPSGMYYAHIQIEDLEPTTMEIFLLFLDPADFLGNPNAVTDENGEFQIPDSLIPVGETLTGLDETGQTEIYVTVTDVIKVLAVIEGDPTPVFVQVTINYQTGENNGGIELVLP